MNCLEQVIIHDGYGHPIYFRTFSGNADLQKYALQSMEKLNELLNETKKPNKSRCTRALIFDGFRKLCSKSQGLFFHHLTQILQCKDTNQIDERKFKHRSDMEC